MIFYFHGFSSGAKSQKATTVKNTFLNYDIVIPDYASHRPRVAIHSLRNSIEQSINNLSSVSIMLIGSSLGGFYAQYLATQYDNVKAVVLINPCLQPQLTLKSQIGRQTNCVTGRVFDFTPDYFNEFLQFDVPVQKLSKPSLVLLDEGDEHIDYSVAVGRYKQQGTVIVYPGGDHWFRHMEEALPEIAFFYEKYVQKPVV